MLDLLRIVEVCFYCEEDIDCMQSVLIGYKLTFCFSGKHAMRDFVELLPEADYSSDDVTNHTGPDDLPSVLNIQNVLLYESVCCALTELVTDNVENATLLYEAGAIPKLVEISRGGGYRY